MTVATLTIDLDAVVANWRALDALSAPPVETAAVIKADGYGLNAALVATALLSAGAKTFFVASVKEAHQVAAMIGAANATLYSFSGFSGDPKDFADTGCIPLLNSLAQMKDFLSRGDGLRFGLQIDTGMNRLGMEADELAAARQLLGDRKPTLVMSHLACADEAEHRQNAEQLAEFHRLTNGWDIPRSLAATGGTLLGADYHFDLTRPGVGLYGGAPFSNATPVVNISIPVIQVRDVAVGESVGYGASWVAQRPSRIATLAAGYADGLIRTLGGRLPLWSGMSQCPLVGRVSMDLLTADVTDLADDPHTLEIVNAHQTVDSLATAANTIGYEILTSLGGRYERVYIGGAADGT